MLWIALCWRQEHSGFRRIDDRYVDIGMAIDMAADVGMERERDNDWTLESGNGHRHLHQQWRRLLW